MDTTNLCERPHSKTTKKCIVEQNSNQLCTSWVPRTWLAPVAKCLRMISFGNCFLILGSGIGSAELKCSCEPGRFYCGHRLLKWAELAWFLSKNHVAVLISESGVHLPMCVQEWEKEVIFGRCIGFSIAYYFQIVSARSKSFGGKDSKTYLVA